MSDATRAQHIKEFFDEDSRQYLSERYPSAPKTCDQFSYLIRKQYVLEMLDRIPGKGRILDIGCGPAVYTRDLVGRGWQVTGVDLSSGMLQTAAKAAAGYGGKPVRFAAAQATELPFRSGSFDAVLCIGVVSYVDSVPALLEDVRRVLKPGGEAILQISNSLSISEIDLRLRNMLGRLTPRRGELDAHDRFRARVLLHPYRPAVFDAWCGAANLRQREFRYFDFRPPLVIDRLAPALSLTVARRLEAFSRSRLATGLGSGYLVRVATAAGVMRS
jgi:ubiquinone/menaquinone biosynthesis C-methylase UbiE